MKRELYYVRVLSRLLPLCCSTTGDSFHASPVFHFLHRNDLALLLQLHRHRGDLYARLVQLGEAIAQLVARLAEDER